MFNESEVLSYCIVDDDHYACSRLAGLVERVAGHLKFLNYLDRPDKLTRANRFILTMVNRRKLTMVNRRKLTRVNRTKLTTL